MEKTAMPPGTLEMLSFGYSIANAIQQASGEVLQVEEGSPYPALQRMLLKGWVVGEWVQAGPKRQTRVYPLTVLGRSN